MKNLQTYYYKKMPDPNLGIDIFLAEGFYKGRKFVIQHIINTDEKNIELKLHCYEEV